MGTEILESDARTFADALPTAPDDLRPQLADTLRRYAEQQQARSQPLWPSLEKQRAEESGRVRDFYTRPDHGLSAADNEELQRVTASSMQPDETKARAFNAQFLAHSFGVPVESITDEVHTGLRSQYALDKWGKDVTESQFFANQKADFELEANLGNAAVTAASQTAPSEHEFSKWLEGAKTQQGFRPARVAEYREAWSKAYDHLQGEMSRLKPVADAVWNKLSLATDETGLREVLPLVRNLDDTETGIVMSMLQRQGENSGEEKGFALQSGEALYRSIRDVWTKSMTSNTRAVLSLSKPTEGTEVPEAVADNGASAIVDYMATRLVERNAAAAGMTPESTTKDSGKMRPLTASEAQDAGKEIDSRIEDIRHVERLQRIADEIVDPVKGANWFTKHIYYPGLQGSGVMVNAMLPGHAGLIVNGMAYADDEYNRLRDQGVSHDDAMRSAPIVGSLQGALDQVNASVVLNKLPILNNLFKAPVAGIAQGAQRFAGRAAADIAILTGVQQFKSDIVPPLVQQLSGQGYPVAWLSYTDEAGSHDGVLLQAMKRLPEAAGSMLMLGLLGAGVATAHDIGNSKTLLSSVPMLRAYDLTDAQANEVRMMALRGDLEAAQQKFAQYAKPALTEGRSISDAAKKAVTQMKDDAARLQSARDNLGSYEVNAPELMKVTDGWKLRFEDGTESEAFKTHAEADAARWQHVQDIEGFKPVEAVRQVWSAWEQENLRDGDTIRRAFDFVPMTAERAVAEGKVTEEQLKRRTEQDAALMSGKTIDTDFGKATALNNATAESKADALAGQTILGTNQVVYADNVRRITTKLFAGGGIDNPVVAIEEDAESTAKHLLASGQRDWLLSALREYEGVTGDKLFRTADDSLLKNDDLVEAFSHFATSVFLGRAVKGEKSQPAIGSQSFRSQLRELFGLRVGTAVNAMAQKYKAAFQRFAAISDAMKASKGTESLAGLVAKSFGMTEQHEHAQAVQKAADALHRAVTSGLDQTTMSLHNLSDDTSDLSSRKAAAAPKQGAGSDASEAGGFRDGRGISGGSVRLQQPTGSSPVSAPLRGLPARIKVPGHGEVVFGAFEPAREAARQYMAERGLPYNPPKTYAKVDKERAGRIAMAYDAMPHAPNDPAVKASYDAMIAETVAQWEAIKKTGLKVEPIRPGMKDPYAASPRLAIMDVVQNNHLWFFPTDFGFGGSESAEVDITGNPLLQFTGETMGDLKLRANDVFRIVHDYFGHIKEGVGFRADGEENAWRAHASMYSEAARPAMTTETRGQNSWVNFGPFGEFNQTASGSETQYAPQKTGLLPDWVMTEGAGDKPEQERPDITMSLQQADTAGADEASNEKAAQEWKKKGVKSPFFKRWFKGSKVVDENKQPLKVYHGTTHDFTVFNKDRANVENDFGQGYYFSNTHADVDANYRTDGPDLTNRIEQLAEKLQGDAEMNGEEMTYDEARKLAKEQLHGGNERIIAGYLRFENPAIIGGKGETYLHSEYNEDTGELSGSLNDFLEAFRRVAWKFEDVDVDKVVEDTAEQIYDGASLRDIVDVMKKSEGLSYATDENGALASGEIIRETIERAGFDGIIDRTVNKRFGSESRHRPMAGMHPDTVHFIAFHPEQFKSEDNRGTFSRDNPDMTMSLAPGEVESRIAAMFDPLNKNPEIRTKIVAEMKRRAGRLTKQWEQKRRDAMPKINRQSLELLASGGAASIAEQEAAQKRLDALDALESQHALELGGMVQDGSPKEARQEVKARHRIEVKNLLDKFRAQEADAATRESTLAALRTLDAITSALPAEVRAKVGGVIDVAKVKTDEARVKAIENRADAINKHLEKYLRDDYVSRIEKLFERYAPSKESGDKPKGKIGADEHVLLAAAQAASALDAAHADAEVARLEALIDSGTLTPEQEALARRQADITQLFGNMHEADAASLDAAHKALKNIVEGGYAVWKLKQLMRSEDRQIMRDTLEKATGKTGGKAERDKAAARDKTMLGKLAKYALDLSSFPEVLRRVFPKAPQEVERIVDLERNASNRLEDAMQSVADELTDLFTALAGDPLKGEQLRFDMSQKSIDAGTEQLSQLEAIQALLMWRQEDGRRHMEGPRDENGKPTAWAYDQVWIDNVRSQMTREAQVVMDFISAAYAREYGPLNALYRERHGIDLPGHDNYAPLTVKPQQSGKAGEMVDPVTGSSVSGSLFTPGSLRTRAKRVTAEPEFRDALQTFIAHTRQIEHWKAYYDLAVDGRAIFGNRDLSNAIQSKDGAEAVKVLQSWLNYFSQGGNRDAGASLAYNQMMNRIISRASTVALVGRVSTLLVQATQLASAAVKMPAGEYLRSFSKLMSGQLDWRGAIQSDFIQRRLKTMPPLVRQAMQGLASESRPNVLRSITHRIGELLNGADGLFTAGTYAMLLDYHRKAAKKLGMTGAEAEVFAHAEAERATESVAQPVRPAMRSLKEVTTTDPLGRALWSYASEARQKIALMAWAAAEGRSNPKYAAKVAALTFIVGGSGAYALKGIFKMAKGDDSDEYWSPARIAKATILGPLQGVPGFTALTDTGNMFSGFGQGLHAVTHLANDEEHDPIAMLRDVESILSAAGLFNEDAASLAALSHAGVDGAKLLTHVITGEPTTKK